MSMKIPGKLSDSTTGAAGEAVNDTTASVKDDVASLAAKVNALIDVVENHEKRLSDQENR